MFGEKTYNFEENISKIGKRENRCTVSSSSSTSRERINLKMTIVTLMVEQVS